MPDILDANEVPADLWAATLEDLSELVKTNEFSGAALGLLSGSALVQLDMACATLRVALVSEFACNYLTQRGSSSERESNRVETMESIRRIATAKCGLNGGRTLEVIFSVDPNLVVDRMSESPAPLPLPTPSQPQYELYGTPLIPSMVFQNFVVVQGANSDAFEVASDFASGLGPDRIHFHGPCGIGKTRLAQAICHELCASVDVAYLDANAYCAMFRNACSTKNWSDLNYLNDTVAKAGVAVIDDLHVILQGTKGPINQFVPVYQTLHQSGARIITVSNLQMTDMTADEATISRLLGHETVEFQPPNLDLRLAILLSWVTADGLEIESSILEALAQGLPGDVRIMQSVFSQMMRNASRGRSINYDFVQSILARYPKATTANEITDEQVVTAVLQANGFTSQEQMKLQREVLNGNSRPSDVVLLRTLVWYVLVAVLKRDPTCAANLLHKDRSSVYHAVHKVEDSPSSYEGQLDKIKGILGLSA